MTLPHVIALAQGKVRVARAAHKVRGEVAVTAGFVPFKVPGSPVVEKTVFPSPLSRCPLSLPRKKD